MYAMYKPTHQRTLTLYRMRHRVPLTKELKCSLIDAFEIQKEQFEAGTSCCQIIIDEENKIIYSLSDDAYLDEDFKYKLNGTYKVLNSNYFSYEVADELEELNVLDASFTKNTPKYDGKILTEEEICNINCALQIAINTLTILLGNSYIKVREINDKKLFARHKGGTLTPETSLNRDTEEERKIMDSVVNDKK